MDERTAIEALKRHRPTRWSRFIGSPRCRICRQPWRCWPYRTALDSLEWARQRLLEQWFGKAVDAETAGQPVPPLGDR